MRLSITLVLLFYCFFAKTETFTLVQTGNWEDASTWTTPSGTHTGGPGDLDDVIMNDPGQGNPMLTVILNGNVAIRSMNYDGDYRRNSLIGTGIISLSENSSWVGGIIGGNIELVVPSGKVLTLSVDSDSSNRKVLEGNVKITNGGTMTWEGNGIFFYDNALIENNSLFIKNTDSNWLYSETNSTILAFVNNGTFNCNGQLFSVNINFQNTSTGTLNINSGSMFFSNLVSNEGVINLFSSGSQNHILNNYTRSGNGIINFKVNTVLEVSGTSNLGSVTAVTFGQLVFGTGTTTIDIVIPSNISFDFGGTGTVTLNVLQTLNNSSSSSKNINGSGKLTIPSGKTFTWNGGNMSGSVEIVVASNGILELASGNNKEIQGNAKLTIAGNGTANYISNGALIISSPAQMEVNGTFDIAGDFSIFSGAGTGAIVNNGVFRKSSGAGIAQIQPIIDNNSTGIFSVQSGTLNIFNKLTNDGEINVLSGAVLEFDTELSNELNAGSTYTGTGSIRHSGATTITNVNSHLSFGPAFMLESGTIQGLGSVTVPGGMTFSGGYFNVDLTVPTSAILTFSGAANKNFGNITVTQQSTVHWNAGDIYANGTTFDNTGTWNCNSDNSIYQISSLPTFNNFGTFKKTTPGLTIVSFVLFNNSGTVGGTGSFEFDPFPFSLGGIVAPGFSTGTLELVGDYILTNEIDIEVDGTEFDRLNVTGNLTIGIDAIFNIIQINPPSNGSNYTIIEVSEVLTCNFNAQTLPSGYFLTCEGSTVKLAYSVLPIELVEFKGNATGESNVLHWKTATETNTAWHIIERSNTGSDWVEIGRVPAAGTSLEIHAYDFEDQNPLPVNYYRLRTVDLDGSFEYSKKIVLASADDHLVTLNAYPNPAAMKLNVEIYSKEEEDADLLLADQFGRILRTEKIHTEEGLNSNELIVSDLPAGIYYVEVKTEHRLLMQKFIKY